MKTLRLITFIVFPLLFSCHPKKPDIPMTEVPAGPFVQALEQQRQSFSGLQAIANVEVIRRGKKRSFDTVGIVLNAHRKLRVEAFGPLGQSLVALVWDGDDILLRMQDDARVFRPGQAGIERLLGVGVEAKDLCAILSGTVTEITRPSDARAFCAKNNTCVIELPEGEMVRRIRVLSSASSPVLSITGQELYRSNTLMYRTRYERMLNLAMGILPGTITIENTKKGVSLTIEYDEADVNVPVDDDAFTLEKSD